MGNAEIDNSSPPAHGASMVHWFHLDPSLPTWIGASLLLAALVVVPLWWLFATSLRGEDGLTLLRYQQIFTDLALIRAIRNSLIISFWAGLLATSVGSIMGWLVTRTNIPLKMFFRTLVLASFVTPPFVGAFAWTMLAGPNAGWFNHLYRYVTGSEGHLVNIYSMGGVVFVIFLYSYPYAFTMISNALDLVSSEMEEASAILGANRLRTAASITLPLVIPALLSGFVFTFVHALALFGVPAILAMPAGFHTITTQIWVLLSQAPQELELVAALSVFLLSLTVLLLSLQKRFLGKRSYATIMGRGMRRSAIDLGYWRYPALLLCLFVVALAVFLPYLVLIKAAFSKAWAMPLTVENLTLENWRLAVSGYSATGEAIFNTLELGVLTGTVGAGLAAIVAYIVDRRLFRGYQLLAYFSVAPTVIPGIVLAAGLLMAYSGPPFFLYGTIWILFIAYLTKEIPVGYTQADTTIRGIHVELEEASRILGANRLLVLKDITLPLAKGGILAAWLLMFIGAVRELSASILLYTSRSWVLSVLILDLQAHGVIEIISVLSILMLCLTLLTVLLMQELFGRDMLEVKE
ncbi:iron ABC transporter permease [bacterium]|nr:MAG: iron ABC transporter permease [bacterium]